MLWEVEQYALQQHSFFALLFKGTNDKTLIGCELACTYALLLVFISLLRNKSVSVLEHACLSTVRQYTRLLTRVNLAS